MYTANLITWLIVALLASCKNNDAGTTEKPQGQQTDLPFTAAWNTTALAPATDFSTQRIAAGPVDYLDEASGLAVSRSNPGHLWAHNDSGNEPYMYLMDKKNGKLKATYSIPGIEKGDFEDMAIGAGPEKGKSYIYFADIGDNAQKREQVLVYRFEEPAYEEKHSGTVTDISIPAERFSFAYPDGPRDAETILIDPASRDLYLISKRQSQNSIYVAKNPLNNQSTTQLTLAGTFPFTSSTAGSIAADGNSVMIKTYTQVFYWKNINKTTILRLLSSQPQLAPYETEPQGEAICIDHDGYYTLSERSAGKPPVLYFYGKK